MASRKNKEMQKSFVSMALGWDVDGAGHCRGEVKRLELRLDLNHGGGGGGESQNKSIASFLLFVLTIQLAPRWLI